MNGDHESEVTPPDEDEARELTDDELDDVAGGSAMASTHLPPA